jgi:excisionase family DNA binding protein
MMGFAVTDYCECPQTMKDSSSLLTAVELAAELKVGRRTIGAWTKNRRIPALKLGRRCVRYDLNRVKEALAKYEQEAVA